MTLLTAGCASTPRSSPAVIAVPFIPQHENLCGPAALAMLATFHGHNGSQQEIARDIYLPAIQGALTVELADYARRYGLWTRQYRGSVDDLRQKLAAGVPLLVLGRFGSSYHYFIVLADGDPLVVHTDRRARHKIRREDFLRYWNQAGRWTLLVCSPEKTPWDLSAAEHNDLGLFLEKIADDPCMAEAAYREAVELEPDHAYYRFNLGNALLRQNLLEDASAAFRQALALDPDNADAMNNLAWSYHERDEHLDDAVALARRAAEINPAKQAYYLDTLASLLLKQGNPTAARTAWQQALAATTDRQAALRRDIEKRLAALAAE